ncbi:hypothetical protein Leryth_018727 [Lithospermum erythrorhizon]|nr:hypothetical protein Leryth_018727 [Lithospermum erythrorhizon]
MHFFNEIFAPTSTHKLNKHNNGFINTPYLVYIRVNCKHKLH